VGKQPRKVSGPICAFGPCRKPVTGDARIELRWVGGQALPFGPGIANRPLEAATGPLAGVYHARCWRAQVRRVRLLAARAADPAGYPGPAPDWREPETCDVEDLRGGVARDYRGAGTAPD
jgi:hypothetical protein